MTSLVSSGLIPYQTIIGLAIFIMVFDIAFGYAVLPFHKGTIYLITNGKEDVSRKFLASYLTPEQVDY